MTTVAHNRPARVASLAALAAKLPAHATVYLPGASGETPGLADVLFRPDAQPLHVTGSVVPGVNTLRPDRFPASTTYTSMFPLPNAPGLLAGGQVRHLPMSYGAFAEHMARHLTFDVTFVSLSPPDDAGNCSLGLSVEFTLLAVAKSKRVFGVINHQLPPIVGAPSIPLASLDAATEIDAAPITYDVGPASPEAEQIAGHISGLVDNGAALQIGIGKVPDALMSRLTDRRQLRLFSGMLSDGALALADSGSLDPVFAHTCCLHLGTAHYYRQLRDRSEFRVRGCDITHAAASFAALPGFVSVNSALSVDLFGQANLEMLDGRMLSGCGGAPDFARGARLSRGGIGIIALPSTAGRAQQSRIVAKLDGLATLPRDLVDVIVTEHGVADLRGLSVPERANRIIAVAAPAQRAGLTEAWRGLCAKL